MRRLLNLTLCLTALDKLELETYLPMLSWPRFPYARQVAARRYGTLSGIAPDIGMTEVAMLTLVDNLLRQLSLSRR